MGPQAGQDTEALGMSLSLQDYVKNVQKELMEAERNLQGIRASHMNRFTVTSKPRCIPLDSSSKAPRTPFNITSTTSSQASKSNWVGEFKQRLQKKLSALQSKFPLYGAVVSGSSSISTALRQHSPPLPSGALALIQGKLSMPEWTVLVEKFAISFTTHDLISLQARNWLNDNVINFYFELIRERALAGKSGASIHIFNTFFYSKLKSTGFDSVRRWTKKVDIFSFDVVLIPLHLSNHWCCAELNMRERCIYYYDSLGGSGTSHCRKLLEYLVAEHLDKKGAPLDPSTWSLECPYNIPHQQNGYDCGVFACTFAECRGRQKGFSFTQKDMQSLRTRMSYEILSGTLL